MWARPTLIDKYQKEIATQKKKKKKLKGKKQLKVTILYIVSDIFQVHKKFNTSNSLKFITLF